jgi:hypothetical protein
MHIKIDNCFAVDAKAKPLFRARMRQLASCFPNVFLTQRKLAIAGEGFNTSDVPWWSVPRSWPSPEDNGGGNTWSLCRFEKTQSLNEHPWSLTQNHDIQAKTNAEMVRIFQWLDGAHDIGQNSTSIFCLK